MIKRIKISKFRMIDISIWAVFYILIFAVAGYAQQERETFTGTVLSYGTGLDTRTRTSTFTLRVNSETPDADAGRFLSMLQDDGQDALRDAIRNEDRGSFSIGGRIAPRLNVVRETVVDGKRRIYIVFERWTQFGELRGGHRSLDYPFGVIELHIDPRTGRGEGTYIAAAKIRWKRDKGDKPYIEVEDFGTYPARLLGVRSNRRRL